MARARNIKPGFFRNCDLVELSFEARLLFIGLWTLSDREGRIEDRPKQIKMELFPADNMDCDQLLGDLFKIGMIDRYEQGGLKIIQVINFKRHQNPHVDEKQSTLPDRLGNIAIRNNKLGKHSASTVQAQCKDDKNTVPILLNPESLILNPDLLNPDLLNPERGTMSEGTKNVKKTRDKPARFEPLEMELPECINPSAWKEWIGYRRSRKLALPEATMRLQVKNLESWFNQGHDPNAIINDSIGHGWQGLFCPKGNSPHGNQKPEMTNAELVDMIFAKQGRVENE